MFSNSQGTYPCGSIGASIKSNSQRSNLVTALRCLAPIQYQGWARA